jgi:ribonuclease R
LSTKKPPRVSSGSRAARDPHYAREAERYDHPLPSRELILETLAREGIPVQEETLCQLLHIETAEVESFRRRLRAMEREGQIMRNRRDAILVAGKLDLVAGRVEGHPDGYGFLVPDEDGPDMFLSEKEMRKVLHGDRVMARASGVDRRGRPEGAIVEIISRANTRLVGRLHKPHGVAFVAAENRRISQDILIPPGADMDAKPGQVVTVEIVAQPNKNAQPAGRIVEVLGNYADPGMEIEIALRKHELPYEFSSAVMRFAEKLPDTVRPNDSKGREDLRALPLVTIDGETARDFDDAVHCKREGKGFRLWVAIADVSHYVRPGDVLDAASRERGNSVYFPRRVIPMLPEKLSNGLCSLNPDVDRLCMVCEMSVDAAGEIGNYRFYAAVMRSQARLTYNRVAAALGLQPPAGEPVPARLLPHLQDLYALYHVLAKARAKRGAIDFETIETQMLFDPQGKIEKIVATQRNDAHRLIEECMLAANVCASDFLQSRKHPALYRVHEGPTPEKLEALRTFLKQFGLDLPGGDAPHAKDYAKLLAGIKGRPDIQLLQTVLLRSLKQAQYSPDNVGHFGLAYEAYTHFTSPIRRYPDLVVHRAINAALAGKTYSPGDWDELGAHCSMTERRADEATRDVESWLKCYYMQDRIGEEFPGSISAVTGFGIFVALDDVYVEGLVHISELGEDYYHFDAARHQLLGERNARRFRLADRVRVKLVRVDLDSSKIDFRLAEEAAPVGKKAKSRRS